MRLAPGLGDDSPPVRKVAGVAGELVHGSRPRLPLPVTSTARRRLAIPACSPEPAALTEPMSLRAWAVGFTCCTTLASMTRSRTAKMPISPSAMTMATPSSPVRGVLRVGRARSRRGHDSGTSVQTGTDGGVAERVLAAVKVTAIGVATAFGPLVLAKDTASCWRACTDASPGATAVENTGVVPTWRMPPAAFDQAGTVPAYGSFQERYCSAPPAVSFHW